MPSEKEYILAPSPHVFRRGTTRTVMMDVIIALIPAMIAALYFFRVKALLVIVTCTASCVMFEYLFGKVTRRKIDLKDYSAALTGILLALVMPPTLPIWMCVLAGFIAIVLTKQLFGGLGYNIFNPALMSRAFLMAAFPIHLTTWSKPVTLDIITGATPLGLQKFEAVTTGNLELFMGNVSGCIGETSAVALIIGGVYLLARRAMDYRIPLSYALSVAAISLITHIIDPKVYAGPAFHILSGGFLLGAIFMATDPVTSPVTKKGRWVFGIGCGVITMIIRLWGGLPEGVMYSIILMNACGPLINRVTRPRRYGT